MWNREITGCERFRIAEERTQTISHPVLGSQAMALQGIYPSNWRIWLAGKNGGVVTNYSDLGHRTQAAE